MSALVSPSPALKGLGGMNATIISRTIVGGAMAYVVAVLVGLSLGALQAGSRVPTIRILPMLSCLVLTACTVIGFVVYAPDAIWAGPLLVTCGVAASGVTAGLLWAREGLDEVTTLWGWIWQDALHPRYVRELYRLRIADRLAQAYSGRPPTL